VFHILQKFHSDAKSRELFGNFRAYEEELIRHAFSIVNAFKEAGNSLKHSLPFFELLFESGTRAWQILLIKESLCLLSLAEEIMSTKSFSIIPTLRARAIESIAIVCDFLGIDREFEAHDRRQSALGMQTKSSKPNETNLCSLYADLALSSLQVTGLARSQENLHSARELLTSGVVEPFKELKYYRVRAFHEMCLGNVSGAIQSARHHEQVAKEYFGPKHSQTLICRLILGSILFHSGKLEESTKVYFQLGLEAQDFPSVQSECESALGAIYLKLSQLDNAQ
jgi:hypothetical protein